MPRVGWPQPSLATLKRIGDVHNGADGTIPIELIYKLLLSGKVDVASCKLNSDVFHHSSLQAGPLGWGWMRLGMV